ncbi:MAG: M23 family metallopeptidase [Proteiniphilum sp.]
MQLFKLPLIFLFLGSTLLSYSQQYRNPVTIPAALSGNFGELRNNHFHSGIDFKTQQVVDKPIVAIEEGYVSRISVSPGGYGLALYIDHPSTGHTSVYAHLNSFSKEIADWVKEQQYLQERFSITLYPEPGMFPVKKGEQIALSGNTGSSGGPHLHFEIRDTQTEEPLDALEFIAKIPDTRKPDLQGIAFYPMAEKGVINGSGHPVKLNIAKDKAGNPLALSKNIEAWGRIGVAVKAYDRMDGQNNIYGVKHIRLFVDNRQLFSSTVDRYSFADARMLNSFIDFEDWRKQKSFFMKSFLEPGNRLPFYETENNGYIDIDEERVYHLRYELEDHYGNRLTYNFTVTGKLQPIPEREECDNRMRWNSYNSYTDTGFQLLISRGNLYDDICFSHSSIRSPNHYSDIHQVNNIPVALHDRAEIWIGMHVDTLQNKQNLGIVRISNNGSESWIGGEYIHGGVSAAIRELGDRYAISADTVAPVITPIEETSWASQKRIRIRLTDNKSGIRSFRGEINGEFVLFTHDSKSSVYTYRFDEDRIGNGQQQLFTFTATDGAGNHTEYQYSFYY